MMEENSLLVRVLAVMDAPFLPIRRVEWTHPIPAAIYQAREVWKRNRGVAVAISGSDRERKDGQRLIDRLIERGGLSAVRRGRGRLLRLSDDAEDRVRALCGLPSRWLSYETVRRYLDSSWTPEVALNGGCGWGDGHSQGLGFLELLVLPALIHGYAESSSTFHGHVYYRRLADPPEVPPEGDAEPDPAAARLYASELMAERQQIVQRRMNPTEIGLLPLPVAMGQ